MLSNTTTTLSGICVALVYLLDYNICKETRLTLFFSPSKDMGNVDPARLSIGANQ